MKAKTLLHLLMTTLLSVSLLGCGGGDDRLETLEPKFNEITLGMPMGEVNRLVGEPETTEPLPDSGGGMISTWPDETRVLYDSKKQVTSVIHNGASLELK